MKKYKYTGVFISSDGHTYTLEAMCNSFIQALFLLTADAIKSGRHYQLYSITNEKGDIQFITDIIRVISLFSENPTK